MMITVAVVTAVLAATAGYLAARGRKSSPDEGAGASPKQPKQGGGAAVKKAKEPAGSTPSPFDGLPLALGDVVSAQGEERWLCGALVLREGEKVKGVLFVAPEGAKTHAVAVFSPPRRDVLWLSPLEVTAPAEPPASLEFGNVLMTRKARFPCVIERMGQGAPQVSGTVLWALYEGDAGEAGILIADGPKLYAFRGMRLEPDQYDRMGSSGIDEDA